MSHSIQKINSLSTLQSIIAQMKSSTSLSMRQQQVKSLLMIQDPQLFSELISKKGIDILSKWIHYFKEDLQEGGKASQEEESLIIDIVSICEKCALRMEDLKSTRIGRNINKLGKVLHPDSRAKAHCERIVRKWRETIDNSTQDNETEENFLGNKRREFAYSTTNKNYPSDYTKNTIINNNNNINITINTHNIGKNKVVINTFSTTGNSNNNTKKLKSCLKTKTSSKQKVKVKFESEQNLEQVKIFKMTDKPNAPNITKEEYLKIQQEVALNPHIYKTEDLRMKEIKMDKPPNLQLTWRIPKKLAIEKLEPTGKKSKERGIIDDLCQRVLSVMYFDKIQEPKDGESKMFAFQDETIPKIENSKEPTKKNKFTFEDALSYIDSLSDKVLTKENIKEISNILENIENPSPEQKKIIKDLTQRIQNGELQNKPINQKEQEQTKQNNNTPTPVVLMQGMNQMPPRPMVSFFPNATVPNQIKPNMPGIPGVANMQQIDQRMFFESASRMNLAKYKTKPCRNYHSSVGCTRGENCFFIHDPNYEGVEIPNFTLGNYEKRPLPFLPSLTFQNFFPPQPQTQSQPQQNNMNVNTGESEGNTNTQGNNQANSLGITNGTNQQQKIGLAGFNINQNINMNRNMMVRQPMMMNQNMMMRTQMMMCMPGMAGGFRPQMMNVPGAFPMNINMMQNNAQVNSNIGGVGENK